MAGIPRPPAHDASDASPASTRAPVRAGRSPRQDGPWTGDPNQPTTRLLETPLARASLTRRGSRAIDRQVRSAAPRAQGAKGGGSAPALAGARRPAPGRPERVAHPGAQGGNRPTSAPLVPRVVWGPRAIWSEDAGRRPGAKVWHGGPTKSSGLELWLQLWGGALECESALHVWSGVRS